MGNITLNKVRKAFGSTVIIPGIDLVIEDGEFVSSSARPAAASHAAPADRGSRRHHLGQHRHRWARRDQRVAGKRKLAMVFQSYALYPHMTVRNNIAFPLKMAGRERVDDRAEGDRSRARPQPHQLPGPPAGPAFRRPAPARRDRPRDRAPALGLPVRRAALQPDCGAAR